MAGGKVFPVDMVPESVISELILTHPAADIQSDIETVPNDPNPPPAISSQKPILPEPERIALQRKRKHSITPVPAHELDRRTRINGNERTIQERRRELQMIFNTVDAGHAMAQERKKQKQDELGETLINAQVSRGTFMRTEVVPMLPFKGYTLPQGRLGNVVYIGDRERIEGLPWMSVVDLANVHGKELNNDGPGKNKLGGDEPEEDPEKDEEGEEEEKDEEDEDNEEDEGMRGGRP